MDHDDRVDDPREQGLDPGGEAEPVTLPWQEPGEREFKDVFATAAIVFLLALAIVGITNATRGVPGNQLGSALLALALVSALMLSMYGPFGNVGLRTSVDHEGLHVRHRGWRLWPTDITVVLSPTRHLPADQIGTVQLVREERPRRLWTKSMGLQFDGRKLGWMRTILAKQDTCAVLVEQMDTGLRRPWWIIGSENCTDLAAALQTAKSARLETSPDQ